MLPRVFDLFAQEDKTLNRAQGGLGIGLSLVDRIVRAHGGTVEAHSPGRGYGSEFIVRLPCLPQRESPPAGQPTHASGQPGTRRVLVVDDNVDGAESVAMLLEHAGHAVRTARDGTEALAVTGEFRPDIVLLDIGLPGMDGYEVARRLRGRGETSKALWLR
jgi:two-component system CheB/CheR fusion protein